MMKKALLITTVSGFVPQFELNQVHILQEMGYEVHYASNFQNPHYGSDNRRLEGTGLICHQVDFVRSPFRMIKNIAAYRQLKTVLEENSFELIHCHTPMGGVLGRLAAEQNRRKQKKRKEERRYQKDKKGKETLEKQNKDKRNKKWKQYDKEQKKEKQTDRKVFYTAHGFHFYRGAPWKNWLLYYPMERWLASYTDVLITINQEDYQIAKKFHLRKGTCGKVERIHGVGLDLSGYQKYFQTASFRKEKREELGISFDACILISVGELTKRKNHQVVIKALASIKEECEKRNVRYLICGEGPERKKLMKQIRLYHLTNMVYLLGYRSDIKELLAACDCFLFPSKQEGLPVALMEAKAMGLPCICSDIRGNRELAASKELVKGKYSRDYQEKIQEFLKQWVMEPEFKRESEVRGKKVFSFAEESERAAEPKSAAVLKSENMANRFLIDLDTKKKFENAAAENTVWLNKKRKFEEAEAKNTVWLDEKRKSEEAEAENMVWSDAKKYSKERVMQQMRRIYTENLKDPEKKEDFKKEKKSLIKERKEK